MPASAGPTSPNTRMRNPAQRRLERTMPGVNMKMVQQMQNRLMKIQQELAETTVEGTAGGGVVTVQVNGQREFQSIKIDPSAVDPDDVEMLEDLISAAVK